MAPGGGSSVRALFAGWTWRALRRDWRRRREAGPRGSALPVLLALGATAFCFAQVVLVLGAVAPAQGGLEALGGAGNPMGSGALASAWFVAGAGCLGLTALAAERTWRPKVGLHRDPAPAEAEREAPPAPRAPAAARRSPPPMRGAVTRDEVASAIAQRSAPARPSPLTRSEELGASALARLCEAAPTMAAAAVVAAGRAR